MTSGPELRELVVSPASPPARTRLVLGHGALRALVRPSDAPRLLLVTDRNVARAGWAARVAEVLDPSGERIVTVELEPGEGGKTTAAVVALWDAWTEAGAGRDSWVVAVGGGVVGDVAGFAAATYLRGVPWTVVPTTTLAIADSSLGGKVGVNTSAGKNRAGTVHHPVQVVADLDTLATLGEADRIGGWAEVIKAAVIGDAALLDELERRSDAVKACRGVGDLLVRSLAVKAAVVEEDPGELSRREILNFGHTVAHALEHATDHAIGHGQAVAVGMVVEARLAVRRGLLPASLAERIATACRRLGLPGAAPQVTRERFVAALHADKKVRAGRIRVALPSALGAHALPCTVAAEAEELADALTGT